MEEATAEVPPRPVTARSLSRKVVLSKGLLMLPSAPAARALFSSKGSKEPDSSSTGTPASAGSLLMVWHTS